MHEYAEYYFFTTVYITHFYYESKNTVLYYEISLSQRLTKSLLVYWSIADVFQPKYPAFYGGQQLMMYDEIGPCHLSNCYVRERRIWTYESSSHSSSALPHCLWLFVHWRNSFIAWKPLSTLQINDRLVPHTLCKANLFFCQTLENDDFLYQYLSIVKMGRVCLTHNHHGVL